MFTAALGAVTTTPSTISFWLRLRFNLRFRLMLTTVLTFTFHRLDGVFRTILPILVISLRSAAYMTYTAKSAILMLRRCKTTTGSKAN